MTLDYATTPQPITIIVPVFRDLKATRDCLESLIDSNLPDHVSIVVINDCSPEAELSAFCKEFAARADFRLILNETNLGFVKTANKGFALDADSDILLLNSDTVVSGDWLQRIQSCAYRETNIGTVTPFSNNGTICSYPVFPISNELPSHWNTAELDKAFSLANAGAYREIPTAVGFCMYIKRSCLNETGAFDEANFGHGYGEECDFSLRASALGWKHVIAADVFVYHEGGASFGAETTERKRYADKIMSKLHPGYHQLIGEFLQSDSLYDLRINVDAVRLKINPADSTTIFQEHFRYTQSILARTSEYHRTMSEHHRAMLEEQVQRQHLEQLLGDCRQQFADTDRALSNAQKVVDDLNRDIENANIYAKQLREHINNMEQSRSWRYTEWLRKK